MRRFLCFMVAMAGCATTMSPLQKAEMEMAQQDVAAKNKEGEIAKAQDELKAEKEKAEAARKAAALEIAKEAQGIAELAKQLLEKAEVRQRRACELMPELCPKATPAPEESEAEEPETVEPEVPDDQYVDINVQEWRNALRLSGYPSGWQLQFVGERLNLITVEAGQKVVLDRAHWRPGCYRVTNALATFIACPSPN